MIFNTIQGSNKPPRGLRRRNIPQISQTTLEPKSMTVYRQSISRGLGVHGNSTLLAVDLSTISAQNGIASNNGRRYVQGGNNGLGAAHYTNSTE